MRPQTLSSCVLSVSRPRPKSLKVSSLLLSRVCLGYGGQLSDFGLLLVLGQNWPVGVNVVHGQKERDSFYLGPKRSEKSQELYGYTAAT